MRRHRTARAPIRALLVALLCLFVLQGCTAIGVFTGAVIGGALGGAEGAAAGAELGFYVGLEADAAALSSLSHGGDDCDEPEPTEEYFYEY